MDPDEYIDFHNLSSEDDDDNDYALDSNETFYQIGSRWGEDGLGPDVIGRSFIAMLDRVTPLSIATRNWVLLDFNGGDELSLNRARDQSGDWVRSNISTDAGDPAPEEGYHLLATGSVHPGGRDDRENVALSVNAGGLGDNGFLFEMGGGFTGPDLSLVTYSLFRSVVEIAASLWAMRLSGRHLRSTMGQADYGDHLRLPISWRPASRFRHQPESLNGLHRSTGPGSPIFPTSWRWG